MDLLEKDRSDYNEPIFEDKNFISDVIDYLDCDEWSIKYLEKLNHVLTETIWEDNELALKIIRKYVEVASFNNYFDFEIPDIFWKNEDNVDEVLGIICENCTNVSSMLYGWEVFPNYLLNDRRVAFELVSYNYENYKMISDKLQNDIDIIFSTISSLNNKIYEFAYADSDYDAWGPDEITDELESFLDIIKGNDNKDVVKNIFELEWFGEDFELIYKWMDKKLLGDKEFILSLVNDGIYLEGIYDYLSDELKNDPDIIENFKDE